MPVRLDNRSRSMASDVRCRSWFVWRIPRARSLSTSSSVIPRKYSSVRYTAAQGYFAIAMGKLGGVAGVNLDGVHPRYEGSLPVIEKIAAADKPSVNAVLKEASREPVKPKLIAERIKRIKGAGVVCAVSSVPARAGE